jgi:hypothetical protein
MRKNPGMAARVRAEAQGQLPLFSGEMIDGTWTVKEVQEAAKSGDWGKSLVTPEERRKFIRRVK